MNAIAGAGVLFSHGEEIPVAYDFVQCSRHSRYEAEGEIFGDTNALRTAYRSGACDLLLEDGQLTKLFLVSCPLTGAAAVRITSPVRWA